MLITGKVSDDVTGAGVSGQTVYIDANGNGVFDSGVDVSNTTTDSGGNYKFFSLPAGTYAVRLRTTSTFTRTSPGSGGGITVTPVNPNASTANFAVYAAGTSVPVAGVYWGDDDGDGIQDAGESGQSGKTIFVDYNGNDTRESNEPQAVTGLRKRGLLMAAKHSVVETRKSVGIWIRVSTEDQAQGDSPEHHEKRARYYAESKGWVVQEVYHLEAVSGKAVLQNAEAQRMLKDVKRGHISGLIFSKLARLSGSIM